MKTIIELFETSVAKFPENIYLWEKENGKFVGTTYLQTHDFVIRFGAGLMVFGF
jgi:long-chain acyl-CoA synthetase